MTVTEQRRAVFWLGSNVEDRLEPLQGAVDALVDAPGVTWVGVSPVYEAASIEGLEQVAFLNAVLVVDTVLSSSVLLERAQGIEAAMHQSRDMLFGLQSIGVDLVTVDGETSDGPMPALPHPRAHERAFVLVPWCDVDPTGWLPGRGAVTGLVEAVADQDIDRRDDLPLRPPI